MAAKPKKTSSTKRVIRKKNVSPEDDMLTSLHEQPTSASSIDSDPAHKTPQSRKRFYTIGIGLIVLVAVVALLIRNRSWFVAATVNGTPITRMELNKRLTERYGDQMIEAMIGEKLIRDEAGKQGIVITDAEMSARLAEIETSLNGQLSLEEALKLQGVTREEFESNIEVQLIIDKLLSKEVSVSAQEVDDYLTQNAQTLTATDAAARRDEATKLIKSNKVQAKFEEWFANLKENAKVERFIGQN